MIASYKLIYQCLRLYGKLKKQLELLKLGEKISNKLFNSSKEKLICHPEALPVFEAWSAVKKHDLKHDAVPVQMKELYS